MLIDSQAIFSDAQALTATAASTNILDFGTPGTPNRGNQLTRDKGNEGLMLDIRVGTTFVSGGLSTLVIAVQMDDDVAFGSPTTIQTLEAIAKADLVAGYNVKEICKIPRGATERYLRLNYTVNTANFTAGTISAALVAALQTNEH